MDLPTQIRAGLQNQGLPLPSLTWIKSALPNRNPLPPLPALTATVRARFLAADLKTPTLFDSPRPSFPSNLGDPGVKEIRLASDIPVQVLDIENLSKSKWEQAEELEAIARGEQTRGREIIRLPTGNEEDEYAGDSQPTQSTANGVERSGHQGRGGPSASTNAAPKSSTHRVVLQESEKRFC
ncbi:hypothetical protein GGS20DRAFT_572148 [Poronia punctata]|nr:hypothetical protein GGS20DRAFT_572148 [Poronia punctata]